MDVCSICLDDLSPSGSNCHISCGHLFHTICIQTWLLVHDNTCPLCRQCIQGCNHPSIYDHNTVDICEILDVLHTEYKTLKDDNQKYSIQARELTDIDISLDYHVFDVLFEENITCLIHNRQHKDIFIEHINLRVSVIKILRKQQVQILQTIHAATISQSTMNNTWVVIIIL